jgi:hypothetical protein
MNIRYVLTVPIVGLILSALSSGCGFSDYKNSTSTSGTTPTGTTGTGTTTGSNPPVSGTNPSPNPSSGSGATATFSEVNTQIFQPLCVQCHGSGGNSPDLSSYSAFATNTTFVVPGDPATSLVYEMVQSGSMPQGGPTLSTADLDLINEWITQGALNN